MSRHAWAVLALAAALRVGYALASPPGGDASKVPDNDSYVALGASLAERGGLLDPEGRPSALREPGYPVALAAAFKAFGVGYGPVVLVNTLMGLCSLVLMLRLGDRFFGPPVGLAAMALGAVYPAFLFHNAQPMRETALVLASLGAVAAVVRAQERGTPGAWALAAAVGVAASLTNTVFLPFALVLVPAGALLTGRREPARALGRAGAYLAVFVLLYAPWPLRNYARLGGFVLGSTAAAGSSFYINLIVPQEATGLPEQTRITSADPVVMGAVGLAPLAREKYFWREAFKKVAREPGRSLRLMAWRYFVDIWRVVPLERPGNPHGHRLLKWVSLGSDGWILPAAAAGVVLAGATAPGLFWAYALVASVNAVYALILTGIRYRLPAMPWAILLAAYVLVRLARRARGTEAPA